MEDEVLMIREKAIDHDRKQIIQTYLKIQDKMVGEEFVELVHEAFHCFINGCPRASILMSGETLLRTILYKIDSFKSQINVSMEEEKALMSKHFSTAIYVLRKNNVYPSDIIEKMKIIKELRNIAVHGSFPVLVDWDPDDGKRNRDERMQLYKNLIEIPEGYKFNLKLQGKKVPVTFDLRKYKCNSLKGICFSDKYAVIQFLLLVHVISYIFNNTDNIVVFPNS